MRMMQLKSLIPRRVKHIIQQYLCDHEETTTPSEVVRQFHELFYDNVGSTWNNTYWMGAQILKNPFDLWIYQEIIFDTKPAVIVECGTRHGGSALYFASMCDLLGHGRVISIDVEKGESRPVHPRITYLVGSSLSESTLRHIEKATAGRTTMVSLDSDHRQAHVLAEMRVYGQYVTRGCYMVVEDTNLNGHPVLPNFGPGPLEAVEQFVQENHDFEVDSRCEKFLFTFHPNGFLRRIKECKP